MNLKKVVIKNYRSCKDASIELGPMHAIVGANNAGKSTILRALDFLFNPSTTKIDSESFWNGDVSLQIWIEAIFVDLAEREIALLGPYLRPDNTFHMARSAKLSISDENSSDEEKFLVSQHYCKPMPKHEWLQPSSINGTNISTWWQTKETLTANGQSFASFVGNTKPQVGVWKQKADEFIQAYLTDADFEDSWADNPSGYSGVLKGTLPHFIYIPAVRHVSDETKVTKNNPFGRLLYSVIESVTEVQRAELDQLLASVQNRLNRSGDEPRLDSIQQTESRLNTFLQDYMDGEIEIEFQPPTLETLLTTPKILVDDGFRNIVENKGHGLQRAIIFSILRCYSELVAGKEIEQRKSTIFAIEEPELYMHPQAQRTIRRVFKEISEGGDQVIFATHSALLVDVAYFDEIIRVEAITKRNGAVKTVESRIWQLPISKLITDIETRHKNLSGKITPDSMRDLYSHAYHPTRSEGFFAEKIILVEGATEQYSLPIYADALGLHLDKSNIAVVDCGGKGQMDRLYRIFNELGIPCFVVIDYDAGNNDPEVITKSKDLLLMLGECADEPTELLVNDQIACFPQKWEESLSHEISDMSQLTSDARRFLGIKEGGKPLVARYIARKLTSCEPKFIPPSVKTILEKAVAVSWKQSCLKLGEDIA